MSQNIPGLNHKSLHSAYVIMAYVLLIANHPLCRDVKRGGPLGAYKGRLMLAPGFSFTILRLTFITNTLHHNMTLTHIRYIRPNIFYYLQKHITLQCDQPKWYKNRKLVIFSPLSVVMRGSNAKCAKRVGISARAHTHISYVRT